jgi:hypothetical protein
VPSVLLDVAEFSLGGDLAFVSVLASLAPLSELSVAAAWPLAERR